MNLLFDVAPGVLIVATGVVAFRLGLRYGRREGRAESMVTQAEYIAALHRMIRTIIERNGV